jgi:hypothetical protein
MKRFLARGNGAMTLPAPFANEGGGTEKENARDTSFVRTKTLF